MLKHLKGRASALKTSEAFFLLLLKGDFSSLESFKEIIFERVLEERVKGGLGDPF